MGGHRGGGHFTRISRNGRVFYSTCYPTQCRIAIRGRWRGFVPNAHRQRRRPVHPLCQYGEQSDADDEWGSDGCHNAADAKRVSA